jgi:serine/threonine protein kinase
MQYVPFTLEPGVVLAGKYRIERVLGQGGMGMVAAAYHIHLEQRVALKLMLPHAVGSPESVSRFLREARAAARITSDHVARVYDVGTLESGAPYIAMEYLEGTDLSQLMIERGRLPV